MKFIHTADLHLGASMRTHIGGDAAARRRRELLQVFGEIVALAAREEAALLIAGDLFDTAAPSRRTQQYVLSVIKNAPSVRVFCLGGNHDGLLFPDFRDALPENLTLFEGGLERVSLDGVDLYAAGRGDPERLFADFSPDPARKNILLFHGVLQKENRTGDTETLPLSRIAGRGLDYLALGHYHRYELAPLDERGVYCYPGCPEGRGFDECGRKGVVKIDVNCKVDVTFIPLSKRVLHEVAVDVSEASALHEVETRIREATAALPEEDMVKVRLIGEYRADAERDLAFWRQGLSRFFFAEIKDEARLLLLPEEYENDPSLKGEFIRRVMAAGLPPEECHAVIMAGLYALRGEEPGE